MVAVARTWWVALLRGAIALAFALVILLRPHISLSATAADLGVYLLADGVVAATSVLAVGLGWCGALLLTEGFSGGFVALGVVSVPHATPATARFLLAAWALAIGAAEAGIGIRARRERHPLHLRVLAQRMPKRRGVLADSAHLLAGATALAFALALLAVPLTSTGIVVPMLGLFAMAFGYLHVRGGLMAGALAVGHAARVGQALPARPDETPRDGEAGAVTI